MDPITLSALISGGSALLGGGLNAFSSANLNRKNRQFSWDMYARQQADQLANWNRLNEYNSPAAQMKRFQEAGLNPNLIYGQGNAGNATPIPTPDVQTPQTRVPEWGDAISGAGLQLINAIYDLDIKQAQVDNLKAQNTVILQDALLKTAQTESTSVNTARSRFNLDFETELRGVSADARRELLRQLKTNIDISIQKNARDAAANSTSIQEAAVRMAYTRQQTLNAELSRAHTRADIERLTAEKRRIESSASLLQKEGKLRDLDIALRKEGINPNDPMWARVVGRILSNLFEDDGSLRDTPTGGLWNWLFGQ